MGDLSAKIDAEKVIAFSNDLVECLKNRKDEHSLTQLLEQAEALRSHCDKDYSSVHNLLQAITNEIDDLERQRVFIEERRKDLKKLEQDKPRAEMKLSMYASVTNLIPDMSDHSRISGYIVQRDKKVVEKFEFDPPEATSYDTTNSIWEMINKQ